MLSFTMVSDLFELVGKIIDNRYRVDAVVGEGGFGVVYRGYHQRLDCAIAIKCLKVPSHFTREAKELFFRRFWDEAKLLSKLDEHPSIVRVFDFGTTPSPMGNVPYLVLEWLAGEDLDENLQRDRCILTEQEAIRLLRPVVEALAKVHSMGVAHRDLKPANLYLSQKNGTLTPKVLDFGIAKAMQEGEATTLLATRTKSGFSAFSPNYGAPEQFRSKKYGESGPWTDVHALGLILVELLTGKPALEGEEEADYLLASTAEQRPVPSSKGVRVSAAMEAVCVKSLALKPSERFRTAGELLAAMDAVAATSVRQTAHMEPAISSAERTRTKLPGIETFVPKLQEQESHHATPVQTPARIVASENVAVVTQDQTQADKTTLVPMIALADTHSRESRINKLWLAIGIALSVLVISGVLAGFIWRRNLEAQRIAED